MYWLRRPPYLRWIVAALLVVAGFALETRGAATERYPFAAVTVAPGTSVESLVEWRDVPAGLLPRWDGPIVGVAAVGIAAGDPVLPSATASFSVPADWWSVAVPLPQPAAPGTPIRLMLDEMGGFVEGVLLDGGIDDGFQTIGMVAFPPSDAPQVATAVTDSALVVMVGLPSGGESGNG